MTHTEALTDSPKPVAPEDDPWLTSGDLAARFKVSIETIYGWVTTKHLPPGYKLGVSKHSPTRWRLSQITEWENNLGRTHSGPSIRERAKKAAHERL